MSINYTARAVRPSLREPSRAEWRATNLFLIIKSQATTDAAEKKAVVEVEEAAATAKAAEFKEIAASPRCCSRVPQESENVGY